MTERKSLLEALVGIKSDIEAVDEAEQQALGACAASQADQSVLISEFEAMKQGVDKVRLVLGLDKLSGSLTEELEKSRAG